MSMRNGFERPTAARRLMHAPASERQQDRRWKPRSHLWTAVESGGARIGDSRRNV